MLQITIIQFVTVIGTFRGDGFTPAFLSRAYGLEHVF